MCHSYQNKFVYAENALGLRIQRYLYASGPLIWLVPYWLNNLVTSSNTTPAEKKPHRKQNSSNADAKRALIDITMRDWAKLTCKTKRLYLNLCKNKDETNKRNYRNQFAGWNSTLWERATDLLPDIPARPLGRISL